jgi:hypothetical protein
MTLDEFIRQVEGFDERGPTEKIRLFAWYLQRHRHMDRFQTSEIGSCFDEVHISKPANLSQLITQLLNKDLLKDKSGLRASKSLLDKHDVRYGDSARTIALHEVLSRLPSQLSVSAESEYLEEALKCLRATAYRAAIVMAWNVAYDHLLTVIMTRELQRYNQAVGQPNVLGGKKSPVSSREDFQKWKESEVLEVCRLSGITSKEVAKVLAEKLEKRNSAAHPSGSTFDQIMAEAFITDLVKNAVLKL